MDVRAAVAVAAGQPLEITTVQLEGPREGEVMVEIKATGVCHTDEFTLSGADPEGLFPAILGHEGAGVVVDIGRGVTSVKKGDHVIPLYTPECRQCPSCLSRKTNLCTAIRATQGAGPDARRHLAVLAWRQADPSLHGHLDIRELHGIARDRGGKDPRGRAVRQGLLHRLRRHHRHRRGHQHRKGRARRQGDRIRPRRHRAQRAAGPAAGRRRHDHRGRYQQRPQGVGRAIRHDPFRQSRGSRQGPRPSPRRHDKIGCGPDRRRRLHLRLHRQRHGHAAGAGSLPSRLGPVDHHRGCTCRRRDFDAAVPAGDGPDVERHRIRRRARPHRRAEDCRLVHAGQDRDRSDDHPCDAAWPRSTTRSN